jgi:hypothetical protein
MQFKVVIFKVYGFVFLLDQPSTAQLSAWRSASFDW